MSSPEVEEQTRCIKAAEGLECCFWSWRPEERSSLWWDLSSHAGLGEGKPCELISTYPTNQALDHSLLKCLFFLSRGEKKKKNLCFRHLLPALLTDDLVLQWEKMLSSGSWYPSIHLSIYPTLPYPVAHQGVPPVAGSSQVDAPLQALNPPCFASSRLGHYFVRATSPAVAIWVTLFSLGSFATSLVIQRRPPPRPGVWLT